MRLISAVLILITSAASTATGQTTTFISAVPLPEVRMDGESVKIHTQGLYVTEDDYIVTGRVDSPPRRPVVLRFPRGDLSNYQVLELTLEDEKHAALNHPGGFDRDANGVFWIPVSTSHRKGPTILIGMKMNNGKLPDTVTKITRRIELPDHIGAVCCLDNDRLLGANWDTKTAYVINSETSEVLESFSQEELFGKADGLHLAVQDWKYDAKSALVVAGGIDKSADRDPKKSSAIVAWIDPDRRKLASSIRLDSRQDVARPLTNEGMALFNDQLFLLPEDFGKGAKLLRYNYSSNLTNVTPKRPTNRSYSK